MSKNLVPGIAVITAIFGDYDWVPPVPIGFSEAILVSDFPIDSEWSNVVIESKCDPFLSAKLPKFRPDLFCSTESSVWIDANIRDPRNWLYRASEEVLMDNEFVLFRHPNRNSVESEIRESQRFEKYKNLPLERQFKEYQNLGFQDNVGLWACGVIARRHTAQNSDFGDSWFFENARWSIQDQISFSYLVWKRGLKVGNFHGNLWRSSLKFHKHKK